MKALAVLNVINNEKGETLFLLRKGKPFGWGLVGGKIDAGETKEQACVREVFEETQITLTEDQLDLVGYTNSFNGTPLAIFKTNLDFTPEVTINRGEHLSSRWIKTHVDEYEGNYTSEIEKLVFAGVTLSITDMGKKNQEDNSRADV